MDEYATQVASFIQDFFRTMPPSVRAQFMGYPDRLKGRRHRPSMTRYTTRTRR